MYAGLPWYLSNFYNGKCVPAPFVGAMYHCRKRLFQKSAQYLERPGMYKQCEPASAHKIGQAGANGHLAAIFDKLLWFDNCVRMLRHELLRLSIKKTGGNSCS